MNKLLKKFLGAGILVLVLAITGILVFKNIMSKTGKTENSNKNDTVSVVIPVYKVEKYLDACLNSVENQTYDDLEIICVNDGSPDNSGEILKKHQERDKRIKIIDQENKGLSGARNAGMEIATGKWLYFVDSDDMIAPYAIEKIVKSAKEYDADMVKFEKINFEDGQQINITEYPYKKSELRLYEIEGKENPFEFFDMREVYVWERLYKRSFLTENNISFKEGVICEDVLFTWKCELYAKKLVKDDNPYYFYRANRKGSIMDSDFKNLERRLESFFTMVNELVEMRPEFDFENIDNQFLYMMLDLFYEPIKYGLEKNPADQKVFANRAIHILKDEYIDKYDVQPSENHAKKIKDLETIAM